ncbi:sugar ABC transporter permease [Paenibacillus antri]|uniref:Sugar ABC transporter permease n=1 Tax=Paenibacillus antri TaxID=2582848 RepID=A0A5R9G862_9BACL|nr:ABC transporter permease subunit [Paenibacillus antri]TLS52592.1 sugar ABC transporter permease [Paenibacillus antri]
METKLDPNSIRPVGRPSALRAWAQKTVAQRELLLMTVPLIGLVIVFNYLPLYGWLIAFQDFKVARGISGSPFVGFENFQQLFKDPHFFRVLRNTLAMGFLNLIFGFLGAVGLAIALNEVRVRWFKRSVQTITYIPHFVSWVVIANIAHVLLSPDGGLLNDLMTGIGLIGEPFYFMARPDWFWGINTFFYFWKEVGWNAIIYLAVLAGVNPDLYEAADVDGAGRMRKIWHISIPSLMPVAIIMLTMSLGWVIQSGYESQYLLGNSMVIDYSEVLDLYALRYSFQIGDYGAGAAISIFKSVVSILMVLSVNYFAKKTGNGGLF